MLHPSRDIFANDMDTLADFPIPARDYLCEGAWVSPVAGASIDATFYARVAGNSMEWAGIYDNDTIVIDKALRPHHGDLIMAAVDGVVSLRRYCEDKRRGCVWLMAPDMLSRPLRITPENEYILWGVVTHSVRRFRR